MGKVVRHAGVLPQDDATDLRIPRSPGSCAASFLKPRSGTRFISAATTAFTLGAFIVLALSAFAQEQRPIHPTDCAFLSHDAVLKAIADAVAAGEISDPTQRVLPVVSAGTGIGGAAGGGSVPTVVPDDIFFFEDSESLLISSYSTGQLFNIMGAATNAVLADLGDKFDFTGFFLNFVPSRQFGAAFYLGLQNEITGIGDTSFNFLPNIGIAGENIEGLVMMWNQSGWDSGADDVTQLMLAQEFEHRFGLFLNPLPGGRPLQGDNGSCGRRAHWNFRLDAQGSAMEIPEWVGWPTATRLGGNMNFNSDLGGAFSAPDLYVMGYISPEELDSLSSQLRYMDNNTSCTSPYSGAISNWTASDLIAANGTRSPSSLTAQKHFRTAWVMIHLPGEPPSDDQVNRVVDILNDWSDTWESGTLGRGTMDNTLGVPFQIEFPGGTPEFLTPEATTKLAVRTTNITSEPDTNSGLLHYSMNAAPFDTTPLTFLGGGNFEATLPAFPCSATVGFYVSFKSTGGSLVRFPRTAPSVTPSALVAAFVSPLFVDDFEQSHGWTVSDSPGLVVGSWTRGEPVGGGVRGDPPTDFDGSGQCFLTDNFFGDSDVDDGMTTLTSPPIDINGATVAMLEYAKWYTNDAGNAPGEDVWLVEVSANGTDWVEIENTKSSTGWTVKRFVLGGFVPPTAQLRVRFSVSDLDEASVVEAGVDAFRVLAVACEPDVCIPVKPPLPELPVMPRNRFIAFNGATPGRPTAVRITFDDLPPPFDLLNGKSMWLDRPSQVTQSGGFLDPIPGVANFTAATLSCEPFYTDWTTFGVVHVYHEFIVPGGAYSIRAIDEACSSDLIENFSPPLSAVSARWGDTVGDCTVLPCAAPDGVINISDVLAILARFSNESDAVLKPRTDLEPATPDLIINVSDALRALAAFAGLPYSFTPSTTAPCPSGRN